MTNYVELVFFGNVMYDNWSENMRRVILNKLETETMNFIKSCVECGNPSDRVAEPKSVADAKKVLEKVAKIIPQSEESQKLLETL